VIHEQAAQIRLFGIDPTIQGQGLGKRLLQKVMVYCEKKGYKHHLL
jgi:ribosomal protein S18 acetylase RimI-like enzyme